MSPELDEALCQAHPILFARRHSRRRTTPIGWGIECGDGWYDILSTLFDLISWPHLLALSEYDALRKALGAAQYAGGPFVTEEDVERSRQAMQAAEDALPLVHQVKEKFGALRVYLEPADPRVSALVEFAECHSRRVCEHCGAPGKLRRDGWLRTLCDVHAAECAG